MFLHYLRLLAEVKELDDGTQFKIVDRLQGKMSEIEEEKSLEKLIQLLIDETETAILENWEGSNKLKKMKAESD